jgi:GrpB-like predicted nucleotidyltransferase (UPF0157 family)
VHVEYVDYDDNYPEVFERVAELVHSVLPGQRVEHIGSTSVPGLGGRGVLDSVVIAPTEDHARVVELLRGVGFENFPYGAVQPGLAVSVGVAQREYRAVLYVVAEDHEYLRGWLAFRYHMREHPEQVERYAEVKRAALAEGKSEPWAYQEAKTPYLVELAEQIQRAGPGAEP